MSEEKEKEQWERPDREAVIRDNPLLDYYQARGWKLKRDGASGRYKCLCPFHTESTPSFTIYPEENRGYCYGCHRRANVIDVHAEVNGLSGMEALCALARVEYHGDKGGGSAKREKQMGDSSFGRKEPESGGNGSGGREEASSSRPNSSPTPGPHEVPGSQKPFSAKDGIGERRGRETACYDYQDATGRVVFQVVRYQPKNFRQCHIVDGRRVWNMDGVERVPYRLPELLSSPASVWIVEGERDVETLRAISQTATCNPGGAGKWLPAYSQYLRGHYVYLVPDQDEPGQKHARAVLASLAGLVEWVKWVELPREFNGKLVKDIADLREACGADDAFPEQLEKLQKTSRLIERGVESEFNTITELEELYAAEAGSFEENSLDLTNWLPKINVRPLGPGALLGIVAGTGSLKTASVLNILRCNPDLYAVMFQLELTGPDTFERTAAMVTGYHITEIQDIYRSGERINWQKAKHGFKNLVVCNRSITIGELDEKIARASAKLGRTPQLVILDYLQLIRGPARTRYERLSEACEVCRELANKHRVVFVIVSQTGRPTEEGQEVQLFDAKETGSFENSCSIVLALWKTGTLTMRCAVRKNSKGYSCKPLDLKITDGTYVIEEA